MWGGGESGSRESGPQAPRGVALWAVALKHTLASVPPRIVRDSRGLSSRGLARPGIGCGLPEKPEFGA